MRDDPEVRCGQGAQVCDLHSNSFIAWTGAQNRPSESQPSEDKENIDCASKNRNSDVFRKWLFPHALRFLLPPDSLPLPAALWFEAMLGYTNT